MFYEIKFSIITFTNIDCIHLYAKRDGWMNIESALMLCKHKNELCNLMSVIFYYLSKHVAEIFVWANFNLHT